MFGLLGVSVEVVRVRASTYGAHNRTGEDQGLLDRETGPDLAWQWTLAVVVCAALAGVFKKRKYEIEFINKKINLRKRKRKKSLARPVLVVR